MQDEIYLTYKGAGFLGVVPARDLTHDEAKRYGITYLIKSGLYKLAKQPRKKKEGE